MRYVYFPTTAIGSLLYVTEDGASAEVAVFGNEGIVGVSLAVGKLLAAGLIHDHRSRITVLSRPG